MCVVMHGGVREGGSAAEDAPPRCSPLRRGESMYEHCARQEARPSLDQPSLVDVALLCFTPTSLLLYSC